MRLDDLLEGIDYIELSNVDQDAEVARVTSDSRKVQPGSVFVAIEGEKLDGHDYIEAALASGATLIVHSQAQSPGRSGSFVRVRDSRAVYAEMCSRIFGNPTSKLRVIGVTGTNGKTSTTLIARHLLNSAGHRAAALGTLGLLKPDGELVDASGLTTPDSAVLQEIFANLVAEGATHCVMEVSSHALAQQRVAGIEFAGGAFTNLTQDHFDYHGTVDNYINAKALLFRHHLALSGGYSIFNGDDPVGAQYAAETMGIKVVYGQQQSHNVCIRDVSNSISGIEWEVVLKNGVWPEKLLSGVNLQRFKSGLCGLYNIYNCTAASAIALLEGLSLGQVACGLASFPGVPGRLERVENSSGINVYVDYAHTPDALENVLSALREIRPRGSRIITLFGCGGDRDRDKRPKMAQKAQAGSDIVMVTSDNPRTEDPLAIITEITAGLDTRKPYEVEPDRRLAIRHCIDQARPGDIVLIAGKGHEDYQIVGSQKLHFSDREEAEGYLREAAGARRGQPQLF